MKAIRFCPLVRVSTEKQKKKGESLETQSKQIQAYVKALGGTIPEHCWKYTGQESATPDKERELLNSLLEDSSKNIFDAVIVVDPSRWSRDNLKSKEGLQVLRENNIKFFVGTTEFDLHDPTQNLFLGISAEVGEFTVGIGALKSIQNRIEKAKKGAPVAGKMPWGRVYNKATGKWSIDAEKQKIIQGAAQRYILGENIKDIAASLGFNRSSLFVTLTEKSGREWKQRFRYEKAQIDETVITEIPELLTPAMIQKVKDRVTINTNSNRGNRKWFFLLSGFVFCSKCGFRYNVFKTREQNRYYKHRKLKQNHSCVVTKVVPANELENAVILELLTTIGDPDRIKAAIERATPDLERLNALQADAKAIQASLSKVKKQKARLIDGITNGTLTSEEAKNKMQDLRTKEETATSRLAIINAETESLPDPKQVKSANRFAVSIARHIARDPKLIFSKSDKWKRKFVEQVFSGSDPAGKHLGIYLHHNGENWEYEIRASYNAAVKELPLSDYDLAEYFKLDPDYQDVAAELTKIRSNLASGSQLEHH